MRRWGTLLLAVCGLALAACGGTEKAEEADTPGGPPDATEVMAADGDAKTGDALGPDVCLPVCEGRECGPDGQGGDCGTCGAGASCTLDGKCLALNCPEFHEFSELVQKVNFIDYGNGGHPGDALDVDGDPSTCAPPGDCEGGLDNALSALVGQMEDYFPKNYEFTQGLENGQLVILLEAVEMMTNGTPFKINGYGGETTEDVETCDYQAAKCVYCANPGSKDLETCYPSLSFDNATVSDDMLTAGGPGYFFLLMLPLSDGVVFSTYVNMVQVVGTVTGEGDAMKIENALIGGAVRKDKLMEAVDLLPEEQLPVAPDMIKDILDLFLPADIDTDGDGEADSASFALKFGTIAGTLGAWCEQVPQ